MELKLNDLNEEFFEHIVYHVVNFSYLGELGSDLFNEMLHVLI